MYNIDVTSMCNGADFTKLTVVQGNRVELDMADCPNRPTWGLTLKKAGAVDWKEKILLPRSKTPGVDFVYTQCQDRMKSFRGTNRVYSNLKIQPYVLPNFVLSEHSISKPNVMVLLLDSLSWIRMELFLPKTSKFLQRIETAYAFKLTSTVGYNTGPNAKIIFGNGEVFKKAQGMVTSLFEDYSPDYVLAKMYP